MRIGSYDFRPSLIPSLVVAVLLPGLIGLGFWQLARAKEKQHYLDQYAEQAHLAPLIWSGEEAASDLGFHPVRIQGQYQHNHNYLLDNQVHQGVVGFHVYTPFVVDKGTMVLLVNRGWIPQGVSREQLPQIATPEALTWITGRFHSPPGIGIKLGSPVPEGSWPRVLPYMEISALAKQRAKHNAAPWNRPLYAKVLRLDSSDASGFVREGKHFSFGPDRHYAYALQWFALALALLIIYGLTNTTRCGEKKE